LNGVQCVMGMEAADSMGIPRARNASSTMPDTDETSSRGGAASDPSRDVHASDV